MSTEIIYILKKNRHIRIKMQPRLFLLFVFVCWIGIVYSKTINDNDDPNLLDEKDSGYDMDNFPMALEGSLEESPPLKADEHSRPARSVRNPRQNRRRHKRPKPEVLHSDVTEEYDVEQEADLLELNVTKVNETEADDFNKTEQKILEMRSLQKKKTIEKILKTILRKLSLNAPPNISSSFLNISLPHIDDSFMVEDGRHSRVQGDDPYGAIQQNESNQPTTVVMFAKEPHLPEARYTTNDIILFELNQNILHSEILTAELNIYIRQAPRDFAYGDHSGLVVNVYRVVKNPDGPGYVADDKPDKRKKIIFNSRRHVGWQKMNVKNLVQKWTEDPVGEFHGIKIVVNEGDNSRFLVVKTNNPEEEGYNPYLMVKYIENKAAYEQDNIFSRINSDDLTCDENSDEQGCCSYPLVLDFEEMGWDWILRPRRYYTRYCSGDCQLYNEVIYSQVPHILSITNRGVGGCCTPVKRGSLNVTYVDQSGSVYLKILDDMDVLTCGCN